MAKPRFTNRAVDDLTNIWEYTLVKWSERQADYYYEMLISSCTEIANAPDLGKEYHSIASDLFGLRANRHIIFYRVLDSQIVEIIRILHVRMDLKSRILEK